MRVPKVGYLYLQSTYLYICSLRNLKKTIIIIMFIFTFVRTYLLYIITSYHIYNIIMVNIIISYHLLAYY